MRLCLGLLCRMEDGEVVRGEGGGNDGDGRFLGLFLGRYGNDGDALSVMSC